MSVWKVLRTADLRLKDSLEDIWEVMSEVDDFVLLHHYNSDILCNRTVDEFLVIHKNISNQNREKVKKIIILYNHYLKRVKEIEDNFLTNEYPVDDIKSMWDLFEEEFYELEEED